MRPLYKSRLLVACFMCSVAVASAQQTQSANTLTAVPKLVHFAGSFHPAVSQPAGMIGATFAIYSEQEGGTPLWTEEQNVELDASGNYTALLGVTKNGGVPAELFAGGEARWLQVKFYAPGEVDLPRVLLVSVPYALKAGDADTLGGKPASAYLLAGLSTSAQPSVVAQPTQPETGVPVGKTAAVRPAFTTTGTTNYISKFTDTSGDVGNSVMYQNGNNIGLGTTAAAIPFDIRPTPGSPFAQLGVAQTVDYMTLFASDTYGPAFYWDPTKALRFGKGGTSLYNANGFVEYMRIQPNGYVGIGTQTPGTTLEVNGNAQVDGGSILASGGAPVIQFFNSGSNNFSAGLSALPPSTTGTQDTAVGYSALKSNTTGCCNTATGSQALASSTTAFANTATGYQAMQNTTSSGNTASGYQALLLNTTGYNNNATGAGALNDNNTGVNNVADGNSALYANSGSYSTAVGSQALRNSTSGNNNIAIGYQAGFSVTTGSNNIQIGNEGAGSDSDAIRIGTAGTQTTAFIAGIYGVTTSASNAVPVLIDSNGNLGTISSSRRYKDDIQDMADASSGLMRLRPVTFRYKKQFSDGSKPIQYGLIAEEVAEVYPDLVARTTDGQIETVKYQVLDSMLLNELQKQNTTISAQKEQIGAQEQHIRTQDQQIRSLEERLARVEAALEGNVATASVHTSVDTAR
jgi:hypothetical protein